MRYVFTIVKKKSLNVNNTERFRKLNNSIFGVEKEKCKYEITK